MYYSNTRIIPSEINQNVIKVFNSLNIAKLIKEIQQYQDWNPEIKIQEKDFH